MKPISKSEFLFVYGTLRPAADTPWSCRLANSSKWIGRGCVAGALFQLNGYPGMIPSASGRVAGDLVRVDDAAILPVLDEYEGAEYERKTTAVTLDDGRTMEAWVYFYRRDTTGRTRIESGDWLAR